nr:MAG TPA: Transcription factor S-II (TFIIS) [Caudoviricetes sp.]
MIKDELLLEIDNLRFNPEKLFINKDNNYITREEFINNNVQSIIDAQLSLIKEFNGLDVIKRIEKYPGTIMSVVFKDETILNCPPNLRIPIFTYLYWKHKNPKTAIKKRYNLAHIKQALGLENIDKELFIEPITQQSTCYICGGNATISVPSYDAKRIIFKCNECGHFYQTAPQNSCAENGFLFPYNHCNCNSCKNVKTKLYEVGNKWLQELIKVANKRANTFKLFGLPEDSIMKNDYRENTIALRNTYISNVINSNPNSYIELMESIKSIAKINNLNYYEFEEYIIKELSKYKIIYKVKKLINEPVEHLIINYISGCKNNSTDQSYEEFLEYMEGGHFIESYTLSYNSNIIIGKMLCRNLNIFNEIKLEELDKYLYEDTYELNPYFFTNDIIQKDNKEKLILELNNLIQNCDTNDLELIISITRNIINHNKNTY